MKIIITPELAEICGIHAGDGYLRRRQILKTELDISGGLEEQEYYDNHVIPLFNKVFNLNLGGRFFSRGTYGFVIWNKEIGPLFHELGFPYGKKSLIVKVPKIILESEDKQLYARFLRGLFDTDGCLTFTKKYGKYSEFKRKHHHYPIITIISISQTLIKGVSYILKRLDIFHSIFGYQPKNPRDKYSYVISICGVDRLNRWMKLIGIKNPLKLSKYQIWGKFGFCPTNLTLQQRKNILKGKLDIYSLGL